MDDKDLTNHGFNSEDTPDKENGHGTEDVKLGEYSFGDHAYFSEGDSNSERADGAGRQNETNSSHTSECDMGYTKEDTVRYSSQYSSGNNSNFEGDRDYSAADSNLAGSKVASFYTESYKKPNSKKRNGLMQLILVAVLSSIFGGAVVGGVLMLAAPALQPTVKGYFDSFMPEKSKTKVEASSNAAAAYKKVEIEKSESPVTAIAEKVSPSIVGVRVSVKATDFFFGEQNGGGEGSGIILKSDGYIMTNYHVIQSAIDQRTRKVTNGAKIEIVLMNQLDKPYTAQYIGGDAKTDLAVLKIEGTNFPAAEMGNSDDVKVGELAVAIGNPGGLEYMGSVTVGVISGLNRTIPIEDNKQLKLIQTDAAINPGNSGGALVNSKGQVIGVNAAKIGGQGFEGLGFAIPINKAKEITDSLMQFKYVKGRPQLGVVIDTSFDEEMAKNYNVPAGLLVKEVAPMSGAYKAGIQIGDIITKFDGKEVKAFSKLEELKNSHKPGDTVSVEIYRDGETKVLQVKLSEDRG